MSGTMSELSKNSENNITSYVLYLDIWKYRKFPKKVKILRNARNI